MLFDEGFGDVFFEVSNLGLDFLGIDALGLGICDALLGDFRDLIAAAWHLDRLLDDVFVHPFADKVRGGVDYGLDRVGRLIVRIALVHRQGPLVPDVFPVPPAG
ncbi:hypothetical protein [Mesorhizobium sp. IMUNJ 23232]|uniref:hypothetical protein n=1 Tax=Mesorhizobium sp. IMUNJ 23232 TaxID=3376064 RepID=UPI0037B6FBE2